MKDGGLAMDRHAGGFGELERDGTKQDGGCESLNVEIFSVGPLFQELGYRHLYWDVQRPPFFRHVPMV